MKQVTVREVAQAMTEDETPQAYSVLVKEYKGTTYSCAIGGAALKLNVDPVDLQGNLTTVNKDGVPARRDEQGTDLGAAIWSWNDAALTDEALNDYRIFTRPDFWVNPEYRNFDGYLDKPSIGRLILDNADEKTLNTVLNVMDA